MNHYELRPLFIAYFKKLSIKIRKTFLLLDEEARTRREQNETDKYNRPLTLILTFLTLLAVLYGSFVALSPPTDIYQTIFTKPEIYQVYDKGTLSFGTDISSINAKQFPIRLPNRNLSELPEFDPSNINYNFEIIIPQDRFKLNSTALMIPKVWGRSEVYLNGSKVDFGLNVRPLIALDRTDNKVRIHVSAISPYKYGIRATYPLLVSDIDKLREFQTELTNQSLTQIRILIVQLIVAGLFIGLFLVLPNKPELLTFVIFTVANIAYGYFSYVRDQGEYKLFSSWFSQEMALQILNFSRSFILFRFCLEFFRLGTERINRLSLLSLLGAIPFVGGGTIMLSRITKEPGSWLLFQVTQQTYFLLLAVSVSIWIGGYLTFHLKHKARAVMGLIILSVVAYTFLANIHDFWFINEKITSEYRNQILIYFVMTGIITYEFARTERDRFELMGNMPREQQLKFLKRNSDINSSHRGYILLVDGIGFSNIQESIDSTKQGILTELMNNYLLKHVSQIENISILNGTGDGYYFAIESPPSKIQFTRLARLALDLIQQPLEISNLTAGKYLRFRCALGYGEYFVGISKYSNLMRDFSSGRVLTNLARIIGSEVDQSILRVLLSSEIEQQLGDNNLTTSKLMGKHNTLFEFFELNEEALRRINENLAA